MPRTTLDIDEPILQELKRLQRREGKSLGRLVSDLLAAALPRNRQRAAPKELAWSVSPGELRVDLLDKEAVYAILDTDPGRKR